MVEVSASGISAICGTISGGGELSRPSKSTHLLIAAKLALERMEKYTDGMTLLPGPNLKQSRGECARNLSAAISDLERVK